MNSLAKLTLFPENSSRLPYPGYRKSVVNNNVDVMPANNISSVNGKKSLSA